MEYWQEGSNSTATPPPSTLDVAGQNNKTRDITFGTALVDMLKEQWSFTQGGRKVILGAGWILNRSIYLLVSFYLSQLFCICSQLLAKWIYLSLEIVSMFC